MHADMARAAQQLGSDLPPDAWLLIKVQVTDVDGRVWYAKQFNNSEALMPDDTWLAAGRDFVGGAT